MQYLWCILMRLSNLEFSSVHNGSALCLFGESQIVFIMLLKLLAYFNRETNAIFMSFLQDFHIFMCIFILSFKFQKKTNLLGALWLKI